MNGITVTVGKNGMVTTKFDSWTRGEQRVIDFLRGVMLLGIMLGVMWIGIQLSNEFGLGTVGILGTFLVVRGFNTGVRFSRWVVSLFRETPKPVVKQQQPKQFNPNQNQQRPQNNGQQNRPQFQGNR